MRRRKDMTAVIERRRRAVGVLMQATIPGLALTAAVAPRDPAGTAPAGGDYVPEDQNQQMIGAAHVFQPFEVSSRFPAHEFSLGGEAVLAQGAADTVLVDFTVPEHLNGAIKQWVLYATQKAGMIDLGSRVALDIDGNNALGQETPDGTAINGTFIFPDQDFEGPALAFNYPINHGQRLRVILNRVGAINPANYTYRTRVLGRLWPKTRRRRF